MPIYGGHTGLTHSSSCVQMGGPGESVRRSPANSMCSPPPPPSAPPPPPLAQRTQLRYDVVNTFRSANQRRESASCDQRGWGFPRTHVCFQVQQPAPPPYRTAHRVAVKCDRIDLAMKIHV